MSRISLIAAIIFTIQLGVGSAQDLGSPNAKKGGTFLYNLGAIPTTLHPLTGTDAYNQTVQDYTLDSLGVRNPDTYEWVPALASSWEVSKDGKTFEFTIREGVKWHDGKPLVAEDVKFSYDAIVHPQNKYGTAHLKPYYEDIEKVEVTAPNKVKFFAKQPNYNNFNVAIGLAILPKHIYENPTKEQEKKLNKTIIGSGPYKFVSLDRNKGLTFKRNPDWWGNNIEFFKHYHNFDQIIMKAVKDETIEVTMLEKNELDFIGMNAEVFHKKTNGPKFGKSVHKIKYKSQAARGYGFLGFNLKEPLFAEKKVRMAMAHLMNREFMNEKFLFGESELATGPWYKQSEYANPDVKPITFDPKKATELLADEGWRDTDGDQILDKTIKGEKVKFSFTILEPLPDFVKYLTVFKEDAKKVGVEVNIKVVEWNTFLKLLDERKFQAMRLAWGPGAIDIEPKQIWHSSSYANQGSNFIGYENSKVDKLIDKARSEFDKPKRVKILREVYKIIADDVPYIFFFNSPFSYYGHTSRLKRPKDNYNYTVGLGYWWLDK